MPAASFTAAKGPYLGGHGVTGQWISIDDDGRHHEGITSRTAPEVPCCTKHTLGLEPKQALLATAFHEAGHAVIALLVGMAATPITVEETVNEGCRAVGFAGRNHGVRLDSASPADALMVLAAGVQAELLWLESRGLLTESRGWATEIGGLNDQALAREVAKSANWELDYSDPGTHPAPWNYRGQEARALLMLAALWDQVGAVAAELAASQTLSSADVRRLASPPVLDR